MKVDALVFQGAPEPLDEDVVEVLAFPIRRYPDARSTEPIHPSKGRELGGFNRSSQHHAIGGVVDVRKTDVGAFDATQIILARPTAGVAA